ncbi:MAG: hypothetical protein ACI92E_003009 [Oceanicoccus sp.]
MKVCRVQFSKLWVCLFLVFCGNTSATEPPTLNIVDIISQETFSTYKDLNDFIERSPKVTVAVRATENDKKSYGKQVAKSITGSDCDRNGTLDDTAAFTATFYKLWLAYKR